MRQGLDASFGLEDGAALVLFVALCFPRPVGLEVGLGAIGSKLGLMSNFLERGWGWGECGGWIYCFVGLSFFSLFIIFSGSVAWVIGFSDDFFLFT